MKQAKAKLSITLAPDLVRQLDRAVRARRGATRSSVIEEWLRRAARMAVAERLRSETIAYYESLSSHERAEEEAMARASSRGARRLRIDDLA